VRPLLDVATMPSGAVVIQRCPDCGAVVMGKVSSPEPVMVACSGCDPKPLTVMERQLIKDLFNE
jgi:hypothetical protein